ncbi:MAG: universal stress protein [Bacteroidales bacterium]|nr:universal stress protein [Bacteroidales bacterium]
MKTILVPTDFSDYALFALKAAASIARKIKAKIVLAHVYNLPSDGMDMHYYIDQYYQDIKKQAVVELNKFAAMDFLKRIKVEKLVLTDMLMWQIVTLERFKGIDLIVIGSHGKSGFNKIFIGSNTEKIVRLADSPVLTIKNELEDFSIDRMVFASNFYEEAYAAFEKIKFFADIYHSHIDLLKVITPKNFEPSAQSVKLIHDFISKFKLNDCSINIYNSFNIEQGIIDFSIEKNSDLIAIETHGRTGFAHLINGSLTEDLLKQESKPILSIKMQQHSEYAHELLKYSNGYNNWGSE